MFNNKYENLINLIKANEHKKEEVCSGYEGYIYKITLDNKDYIIKRLNIRNRERKLYEILRFKYQEKLYPFEGKFIAKYYGYFELEGKENIVLQAYEDSPFIIGETINTTVLDSKEINKIIKNVMYGLKFIHGLGFRYGDLKIENIVYDKKHDIYRLIDMGFLSEDSKFTSIGFISQEHQEVGYGTLQCLAPEICLLSNNFLPYETKRQLLMKLSRKNDIWSFGVLIFELYTNNTPFANDDSIQIQIIENIQNKNICYPELFKQLDTNLKKLLDQLWTVNPITRPNIDQVFLLVQELQLFE